MKKRQRTGAARPKRRASAKSPAKKRRPAKRRVAPLVVVRDPDEDVWTGPARAMVPPPRMIDDDDDVGVWTGPARATVPPPRTTDDDDVDVWTALVKPERPYAPDWMHAASLAHRHPLLQAAMDELDLDVINETWACRYGCRGLRMPDDGPMIHHYACQYWEREGRADVPF